MRSADLCPNFPRRFPPHSASPYCNARPAQFALGIVLCFCFFLIEAHAQSQDPGNQSNLNQSNLVQGTVVNGVTHEPVGRALVYSPDNRYATMTNGEGHFEFRLPGPSLTADPQNHGVVMAPPGWLKARKPGFLDPPGGRQVQVSRGADVTISLMPEGLIKGRITLPATDPARGINLQLFSRQVQDGIPRWMPKASALTNSSGEFRFAELDPGEYKVLTREWMDNDPETVIPGGQLYGFAPVYFPNGPDFAGASTIQLTAGQTVQADMSLVRQPYYPVKIPVANSEEVNGLVVIVSPLGQRGPGYSLGYNRGRGMIDGQLPNGKYLVDASSFSPNFQASGSVNLTVAGGPAEGSTLVLTRNNSIPVYVKEEFTKEADNNAYWSDGQHNYPMRGARRDVQIRVEPLDEFGAQRSGTVSTPKNPGDDSVVLENLVAGKYWLRLTALRGYVASASMGGTDLLREPLVVVPGASATIDITMRDDNAELEGTLPGVSPLPVEPGGWVSTGYIYCVPQPDSSGQFLEISAGPDGKFDYAMVAPGTYHVLAFATQQRELPYRDAEAMKVYEHAGQVVRFSPGQKVTLELQVIAGVE